MGRGGHTGGRVHPTPFTPERGPPFAPFAERGKVRDPPAPLLHANPTPPPPFCALPPVFA
jgi:hypothetical protein